MPPAQEVPLDLLRLQSAAVTAAANAIMVTDRAGTIVWANPSFTALSGYSLGESIGRNLRDLDKSDQENPGLYQVMWDTIVAGRTWRGEIVNRRKDGSRYPEALIITPVVDRHGDITHFIAIKQDLTERNQQEATLRASELRYRRLFESAKDGVLILDADSGQVMDVNPYLIGKLGYTREQFLGKSIWELGFFKDIVANQDSFAELQKNEYIRYEDKPLEAADGRRIDVEFISNVYLVDRQKVIQCNIRDITARKLSERQLREQNDILSNSHEGVMITNLTHDVTLWNRGATEIMGWTAAEALGHPAGRLFGPGDPQVPTLLQRALNQPAAWSGELPAQTRDGRQIILGCRVSLVLDAAGKPRAHLTFLNDITEKSGRDKMELRTQRLESIGTLSSGISHDLNNILTPILMAAGFLRHQLTDQRQQDLATLIETAAQRGAAVVRQLLTFSRGLEGQRIALPLVHLIKEMADIIRETFPRNISLATTTPPDLWPVMADATQIHQVLMNLCLNARDAMPDGGVLTLSAANLELPEANRSPGTEKLRGPHVLLTISDTGQGIPSAIIDRVFEPFFTTKGIGCGTGLGLSTTLGIVRSHGGTIDIQPAPDGGTACRVYLPALPVAPARPVPPALERVERGNAETILLVDDEPSILVVTRHCLEDHGYRVLVANNGQEAMEVFLRHKFAIRLVITDVMMPVMDGLKLARELRRLGAEVRVIAVSGLDLAAKASELAEGYVAEFLRKPIDHQTLFAAVKRQLPPLPPGP